MVVDVDLVGDGDGDGVLSAELGKHPDDASKQIEATPVSILVECAETADDIENDGSFHG